MGLLDYLFDSGTYGDPQGGLLSRLSAMQGNYTSPGFPDQQAQPVPIGQGYQMPRAGNADLYAPQQAPAATDFSAQSRQPQPPQQAPTFLSNQPDNSGFGDRLMAGFQNFANAGGPLQALAGGISGLATGTRTDPQGMQQQNQRAMFDSFRQALIDNGETPRAASSKAMAAVLSPEGARTILPELFTNKADWGVIEDNPITGKKYGWIDKNNRTINGGKENATPSGTSAGGPGSVLAQGVTYDANRTGEDYLKQFSPEIQAAAKAYINGDTMPTGNARMNNLASYAKTVAQKYATDMGIPFSDALYAEKRKMKTDLAASGNSSAGGILSNGESAFKHLKELGQSMAGLGNYSLNGLPFGGYAANAANLVTNAAGDSERQGKLGATAQNLTRYGQESTKFYAGSGGGVEERMAALRDMNPKTRSSEEMAAYLEKEKSLMQDRLDVKMKQIIDTLGPEEGAREIAKRMPRIQQNIAELDASIAKLRGTGGATSNGLPSGWSVKQR